MIHTRVFWFPDWPPKSESINFVSAHAYASAAAYASAYAYA